MTGLTDIVAAHQYAQLQVSRLYLEREKNITVYNFWEGAVNKLEEKIRKRVEEIINE